jgi:hypothetical protein
MSATPDRLFTTGAAAARYAARFSPSKVGGLDLIQYSCGCWGVWVAQNTPPDDYWQGVRAPCPKHS